MRFHLYLPAKLRLVANWFLDGAASLPGPATQTGDVLVVRLDAIGDFVLWLRAASRLRERYPSQRITLVANALWAPLASQLPYWDEVVAIEVKRFETSFFYRWRCLRKVRRRAFAVAVQPTYSRTIGADSVVRATRASERVGSVGDLTNLSPKQKWLSDRWYTRLVPAGAKDLTEIERNHEFMQGLSISSPETAHYRMPEVAELPARLRFGAPYVVVFPGASWSGRQWPAASFARVIDAFVRTHDLRFVLCGSAQEHELCDEVASLCIDPPANLAGATSLPEFCELTRNARLLIGNETSAVHIAAAVGTPSVCLLGGGHFGRFVPYPDMAGAPKPETVYERMPCFGCNWTCRLPHVPGDATPCVAAVSPDAVIAAAAQALRTPIARGVALNVPRRPPRQSGGQRARGDRCVTPRISIATVVRNGEATLRRTIESVIHQLGGNAEYIIIDGASTDGTLDIIREYDASLAYWVSEPDRGIYDAMNKVLQVATGDWLLFLGADDELLASPEHLLERFTQTGALYYGNVTIHQTGVISGGEFSRYRLMQENICHQAIFYPRAVYKAKKYDTTSGMKADHRYNIELRGAGVPFIYIDATISCFNNQGLSSAQDIAFEAIKLVAIRESFGLALYLLKRARTAAVGLLKRRHVTD